MSNQSPLLQHYFTESRIWVSPAWLRGASGDQEIRPGFDAVQIVALPNDAQRRGPCLRAVEMVYCDRLTSNKTKYFEISGLECHFDGVPEYINGSRSPAHLTQGHASAGA